MARRRDFVRGAAGIRRSRESTWVTLAPVNVTMTAAGGTIIGSLNAAALALRPFTIVRARFKYMVRSDQAAAIETQVGAIGIAVVSDESIAAGVGSIPTPITEIGSDLWLLHEIFMSMESNLTDRSLNGSVGEIDSKAMRKVEAGQDIAIVAEMSTASSTGGMVVSLGGRMLFKLH